MVHVAKTKSVGESILITLVSKEVIAAGAWVSHSPTSYTQIFVPKILALRTYHEKRGKTQRMFAR